MTKDTGKNLENLSFEELQAEMERRKKAQEKQQKEAAKNHEKAKNEFIETTVARFKEERQSLKELKYNTINRGTELYREMFAVHGKTPRDVSQFSIVNDDQNKKIVIEIQERFAFTEEAKVAIDQIKAFFKGKFASRSKMVYNLLDTLLMKNNKGDYDPKLLTKLRSQVKQIDNPELTAAFELLEDCQTVVGSSTYLRAYEKSDQGKWTDIVVQFSSL